RKGSGEPCRASEAPAAGEVRRAEACHPDEGAGARPPRHRGARRRRGPQPRPAAGPPARRTAGPARRVVRAAPVTMRRQEGYHERRLQFTPFEHPDTCRLLETLKAKGIEGLLDFSTTRPPIGVDHEMRDPFSLPP